MKKKIKFDNFLSGDYVDLVCITSDILKFSDWYKWFNDSNLTKFTK